MTPDQILNKLSVLGVDICRRTLLRYETQGLIPAAIRGSSGRGIGRWTDYPSDVVGKAVIVYKLLKVTDDKHIQYLLKQDDATQKVLMDFLTLKGESNSDDQG